MSQLGAGRSLSSLDDLLRGLVIERNNPCLNGENHCLPVFEPLGHITMDVEKSVTDQKLLFLGTALPSSPNSTTNLMMQALAALASF
jgi:hypothetical protein